MAQPLPLGSIPGPTPCDGLQDGSCTGARIGSQSSLSPGIERTGFDDETSADLGKKETCHSDNIIDLSRGSSRSDSRREPLPLILPL
jgi:hypothetical protein